MRIGIRSSHAYSRYGGGFQALKWHILALKQLGWDVDFYTTNSPSEDVLQNWFDNVPIRFYQPHVEKNYTHFINIDHFSWALPEAQNNYAHLFFPHDRLPKPPDGVRVFSNSAYTARHAKFKWGIDIQPLYIPIDTHFHSGDKKRVILHVSRFSEPSVWADKGHRQIIQSFKMISRQLPDWKLIIAGGMDKNQEFYFEELMRMGAGYNIDLMPNQSPQTIARLFSEASIYWHATGVSIPNVPSAQEHMGITPLEAQASGCVPIVYNSGGMPEVVVPNQTGLLFDNVLDLPHMTLDLARNLNAWSKLSQAGQLWASTWMNFNNFVERVDDMLSGREIRPMVDWKPALKYRPEDVTCVIPTYNSPLLDKCLESLQKTAPNMRVLIINNAGENLSLPPTVDQSVVEILNAGQNTGYAGAMRLAEKIVKTPLVLMFNDDIEAIHSGWLENLLLMMNNPTVGLVGAKLLFPDGRLQHAGGVMDFNRSDIGYHRFYSQPDCVEASVPMEVDFCTGACLLVRRELFKMPPELEKGLYYEELWLSNAAREQGLKTLYQPASVLYHREGETRARTPETQEKISRNHQAFVERWAK